MAASAAAAFSASFNFRKLFARYLRSTVVTRKLCDKTDNSRVIEGATVASILKAEQIGAHVRVTGWIQAIRKQKDRIFFDIGDGSSLDRLQVVADANSVVAKQLTFGSSVIVDGKLVHSEGSAQTVELVPAVIDVVGTCPTNEYPFGARKTYPPDYVRQFPHLRSRTRTFAAISRCTNVATMAIHDYLQASGFLFVGTPVITANDCEGGGDVFTVSCNQKPSEDESPFFERPAYLTVSAQFHLEAAACGLKKVYTMGPTFRAENSKSRYHLAEFHMLEAEMAFVDRLDDVIEVIERLLKFVAQKLMEQSADDVEFLQRQSGLRDLDATRRFIENPFVRLTYTEAVDILNKCGETPKLKWGHDLMKVHEQRLAKHHDQTPVFVTNFPTSLKPFYMKCSQDSHDTVEAVDLLVPGVGEICGGSLREDNFETLRNRLEDKHQRSMDSLTWYLDLRRFGTCPHGGFGIGFERFLQFVLGVNSIKDCVLFPCYPHHGPH